MQLNEALAAARAEVSRLHTERERYEETMKKAFMRGVCALNMEAMSMFHEAEQQGNGTWKTHLFTKILTLKGRYPESIGNCNGC